MRQSKSSLNILVSGWFSFEGMGATAGDLIVCEGLCRRLRESNIPHEIAYAPPFAGGVDWRQVSPQRYSHVIFACGPLGNGWPVDEFLARYASCRLVGLNLSMLDPLEQWNPFALLYERDSNRTCRPDLSLAVQTRKVPRVGRIVSHVQREYGSRSRHEQAHEAIDGILERREAAVVTIDTHLVNNAGGLRSSREIESLIAGMDLVITTRLHGMVLAIKNGVPALAIDPIQGGAKITLQARVLGWLTVFGVEQLEAAALLRAFDYCESSEARRAARACAKRAAAQLTSLLDELVHGLLRTS